MTLALRIDEEQVDGCRQLAARIAGDVQRTVAPNTTVSTERATLRLLGVDGIDDQGVPLPNRVVDQFSRDQLGRGVCYWIGHRMAARNCSLSRALAPLMDGQPEQDFQEVENWKAPIDELARAAAQRLRAVRQERSRLMERYPPAEPPWFYCIVATGNIYEDVVQATAAARQGAQIIAVIRSTAQSLLDYVPYGATTEGYAGTFATQENFRIMRAALDETGVELGRYILLCNYCSGLCMPEIAAMGALERLDVMLNDAMYGIIFRDINMLRTLTDQFFSRRINGFAGIILNTGEDNYLKTDDGLRAAHTVLASQFINEQLAALSGVPDEQMGLGHAFEMDPDIEDGFLYELAQALLSRQAFPRAPLKYMPPTRYKTGDIFKGYLQDGLFNLASLLSRQHIQLLGMLSEAVQNPGIHDRYLALQNARYVANNLKHLPDELEVRPGGILEKRAALVLGQCHDLLEQIAETSLFDSIAAGTFAGIARRRDEGRGLEGVVTKHSQYYNPFDHELQS
ncbi:MAG: lysine 5,6-aminomutase subunit alpha TIM-barrel domain-containing protein [Acidobacteriota bacterium]